MCSGQCVNEQTDPHHCGSCTRLLFEGGHRWIDARRYGKLGTLPIDLPGQRVQTAFPIPTAETDARR